MVCYDDLVPRLSSLVAGRRPAAITNKKRSERRKRAGFTGVRRSSSSRLGKHAHMKAPILVCSSVACRSLVHSYDCAEHRLFGSNVEGFIWVRDVSLPCQQCRNASEKRKRGNGFLHPPEAAENREVQLRRRNHLGPLSFRVE